ncbi:MarR family winged helix-turn-helix transcriptional regulator [Macrococcus lamae]|uniref:MarR family transcriptional regulator n=1 Tax=Macrococcus lamae TaxID=198484 RepID=A0A4R6BU82_9STAP|nr:MarR family transcriptional regulator [Macrococcus lamae]TDM10655.1 MarR family transcriptional regulator [Macrococcus lamae]
MNNNEIVIPLEYQLRRIADRIKIQGRSILQSYNISSQQFIAIQWLEEGPMTVGHLAGNMGLAVSTTSEMVDQLILKNCVRREKDLYDKRKVNLLLEQKGYDIIEEVITYRQDYLTGLMSGMTAHEKIELKRSVEMLYQAIGEQHNE